MIRLHSVSKRYPGGQSALADVTVDIPRGQFVILTGASGAGKTTLLRLLYREELPTSGQVLVAGRNVGTLPARKVPYLRRSMGVVFQSFRLIDRKTVFENIAYLPRLLGHDAVRQKRLAVEALRRVGLAHRLQAFPWQLSGGEQQRVAIARALINDPELLLADEPTGNLDPDLARQIVLLLLDCQRRGTTVVMATHDRELIRRIGQRVLTLDRGRLAQDELFPPGDLPAGVAPAPEIAPE
jgi:cell division transport system ATP-binding protein